ncbi:hypothetical protein PVAND_000063 [Polypedilum vanderplanki]|uniref:Cytochrome P450 n=1 Tax=Polypedilum vanderplanki TaxID=319348 RepID=A0A9J6BIP7_POLVA|nr:hypothetical protein PVAND_000063 [Polypedilum vanderplanki]
MASSLVLISISLLFLYLFNLVKKQYNYFKDRGIPNPKPIFPLGNFWGVGLSVHFIHRVNEIYRQFKGKAKICGFFVTTIPAYIALDIELIKNILVKDFDSFHDRGIYYNEKADPLSAHIFSIAGEQWKTLRQKMTTTFSSGKIKAMMPTLNKISEEMTEVLGEYADEGKTLNYRDMASRLMCEIVGEIAFGIKCNALRDPNCEMMVLSDFLSIKDMKQRVMYLFSNAFPEVCRKLNIQITPKDVQHYFLKIINEAIEYREKNKIRRNDYFDMLLQLKNEGKLDGDVTNVGRISHTDMLAACFVFFVAGFETSSTALAYALYELAVNQELQDRTRDEIEKVLSNYDGKVTYEALMNMNYPGQVISESLRKYTPGNVLMRKCTKEYKIPDTDIVIEKGRMVFLPMHAIHNDPEYFPDPEKFDPDRFSPEMEKERNPFTFLPFGEGMRICMGLRFGLIQTRLGLVSVLRKYRVTLNEKTVHPIRLDPKDVTMMPYGGIWLNTEHI